MDENVMWYRWRWQVSVAGTVWWIGWTRRPGWKPWGLADTGILRGGWGPIDVGYVHRARRTQSLDQQGY